MTAKQVARRKTPDEPLKRCPWSADREARENKSDEKEWRPEGRTPVTKTTMKEDGEPEIRRRQSADEEDDDEYDMTQGGPDLSEDGDGDNGKGGGERR